jgi:hypothetical protein
LTSVDHGLVLEHPEVIVGTEVNPTDTERTPPGTPKAQWKHAPFSLGETQSARIVSLFDLEATWQLEEHIDALRPISRPELDTDLEQLPFEGSFAVEFDLYLDAWRAHLQCTACRDQCKRRGEQN